MNSKFIKELGKGRAERERESVSKKETEMGRAGEKRSGYLYFSVPKIPALYARFTSAAGVLRGFLLGSHGAGREEGIRERERVMGEAGAGGQSLFASSALECVAAAIVRQ